VPVPTALGGTGGGGAIVGAATAEAPMSATIAQAQSRGARRNARTFAWSWLEAPTALLSPQQETRNQQTYAEERKPEQRIG
jgi:hypothetical protein